MKNKDIVRIIERYIGRYRITKCNRYYSKIYKFKEYEQYIVDVLHHFYFNFRKYKDRQWTGYYICNIRTGGKIVCKLSKNY